MTSNGSDIILKRLNLKRFGKIMDFLRLAIANPI